MAIRDVTFDSMSIADVRGELRILAPQRDNSPPRLWIATNLYGPAWLNMVSLDLDLLLKEARELRQVNDRNVILFQIKRELIAGQILQWSVFSAFQIPKIGAWLQINNRTFKLSEKQNLGAGKTWSGGVEIHEAHLEAEVEI